MAEVRPLLRDELLPPRRLERRHLISIADLTSDDVERLLSLSRAFARSLEREVEQRRADDRLWMSRRLAVPHDHVVPVERDIHRAERDLRAAEIGNKPPQPLGERHAARVNPNKSGAVEVPIPLDDLVCDAGDRPVQGLGVQEDLARFDLRSHQRLLSGLTGPG